MTWASYRVQPVKAANHKTRIPGTGLVVQLDQARGIGFACVLDDGMVELSAHGTWYVGAEREGDVIVDADPL